jgi:hypothetical protein
VSARPPRAHRAPALDLRLDEARPRLLALPAWRGEDELLPRLLAAWAAAAPAGSPGTLVLVADPARDGEPAAIEQRILAAAATAGADLDACADIAVRFLHDQPGREAALHAAVDGFVALHRASTGHERHARAAGNAVVTPEASAVRAFLAACAPALAA